MSDAPARDLNIEIGQRIQEKFDAYLLGLIFTVLAFSIQTAAFGVSDVADLLEVFSWLSLLIAGLAGLSRMEWTPKQYQYYSAQFQLEEQVRGAEAARLKGAREFYVVPTGTTISVDQYIAEAKAPIKKLEDALQPIERKGKIKYLVLRVGFVIGLVALISARAWVPVSTVLW
jgi:hypothetical protein